MNDVFCTDKPQTNAERLDDWYAKDGPLRHFEERWPGVPLDVAHAIEHSEYVPIHDALKRQAE